MPKKLLDYIALAPSQRKFLLGETDYQLLYSELTLQAELLAQKYSYLSAKRCALICDSSYTCALLLPAIDKLVNVLFIQPIDITPETAQTFYQAGEIEYCIRVKNGEIESVEKTDIVAKDTNYCAWLLATSGTTGEPKLMAYQLEDLISTSNTNIDKGEQFRWGLCYEINRFAGLQVYLQCIASGSSICVPKGHMNIAEVISLFSNKRVNSMSATPSYWRKILMSPKHKQLPLRNITLGGEIAQQTILNALSLAFEQANIQHIYASTEAGVSFSVKDKLAGFPKAFMENSKPCQLKEHDGRLWIKSRNGANQALKGNIVRDDDGYMDTGDAVAIDNHRVYFLGRDNGSINVGGNKVMPEKVEEVLCSSSLVAVAKCYGKTNPMLGELVCADIVLNKLATNVPNNEVKQQVKAHCKIHLANFEVPALIKIVTNIDVNASGKIIR